MWWWHSQNSRSTWTTWDLVANKQIKEGKQDGFFLWLQTQKSTKTSLGKTKLKSKSEFLNRRLQLFPPSPQILINFLGKRTLDTVKLVWVRVWNPSTFRHSGWCFLRNPLRITKEGGTGAEGRLSFSPPAFQSARTRFLNPFPVP